MHALVKGLRQGSAVTVDKSSRLVPHREIDRNSSLRRSRADFQPPRAEFASTFNIYNIYVLPSIPRNLRRVLPHYEIVLAEQKTRSTPGYSWFDANTARKLALNRTANVIFVEIHGKRK